MHKNQEGLTETYNRFHDRDHDSTEPNPELVAGINRLRTLHAAMDHAVLDAYGWHDLTNAARCEFLLDYEDDEDESLGKKSQKKKPWRYRWPDELRDEVLARLLELNGRVSSKETLSGLQQSKTKASRKRAVESNPQLKIF